MREAAGDNSCCSIYILLDLKCRLNSGFQFGRIIQQFIVIRRNAKSHQNPLFSTSLCDAKTISIRQKKKKLTHNQISPG